MSRQNHIIRTVMFDTLLSDEELVGRWRNTMSRINIESVFARALQPFDQQKEWTCIDRLEIDLGEMSWENEEEWNYRIMAGLEEQLSEKIRYRNSGLYAIEQMRTHYSEAISNVVVKDEDNYRLQALIEYLETGLCPWQLHKIDDVAEVLMNLTDKNPALVEQELRGLLQHSDPAVERLIMVLNYQQLFRMIKLFMNEETVEDLISFYTTIVKLVPLTKRKLVKQKMIRELLKCSVSYGGDYSKLADQIFGREIITIIDNPQFQMIQNIIVNQKWKNPEIAKMFREIIERVVETKGKREEIRDVEIVKIIDKNIEHLSRKNGMTTEREKQKEQAETHEEIIFIHNSGLVLLNSALIKYHLEKLGWVQENDFKTELARMKAILWLHYLTHGSQKIQEYELSLVKILCGLHPTDLADIKLRLTRKERKQADELIETVIENWTALKQVSLEGLRQSFLQREGRLTHDEGGWQLHVKSKAYDILIEQLPWSYSIVKFPWMIKPLFTQWSTQI